jgi:hypothetical protein
VTANFRGVEPTDEFSALSGLMSQELRERSTAAPCGRQGTSSSAPRHRGSRSPDDLPQFEERD